MMVDLNFFILSLLSLVILNDIISGLAYNGTNYMEVMILVVLCFFSTRKKY